jgi:hypothetical protein
MFKQTIFMTGYILLTTIVSSVSSLRPRATTSFSLYAYANGDGIGGLPVYYAGGKS